MRYLMTSALLGLACLTLAATAQDQEPPDKKMPPDHLFVLKASQAGMAEVNFGNLAAEKASHPSVKAFARKMVEEHAKANTELAELANKKGMTPALGMDADHNELRAKLAELNGTEFDRAYMESQLKDYQMAISLFETQVKNGQDDDLKKWANEKLPRLHEHLKMAEEVNKKLEAAKR